MSRHHDQAAHLAPVHCSIATRFEWQARKLHDALASRFRHCHVDGRPRMDAHEPTRFCISGWDPAYLAGLALVELGECQVAIHVRGYGEGERAMPVVSLSTDYSKSQLKTLCARIGVRAPSVPMRGVELVNDWLEQEHRERCAVVS